jgi:hypothetical protein
VFRRARFAVATPVAHIPARLGEGIAARTAAGIAGSEEPAGRKLRNLHDLTVLYMALKVSGWPTRG